MLQEASRSNIPKSNPNRFVPRQVLLSPRRAAMADLKDHGSKKENKRKNNEEKEKRGKGSREPLLSSIAVFLESNGFIRTLAELRSEAGIEREYEELKVRINALVTKARKIPEEGWTM
ncbi:putative cellulose synthase A catalytic subunit 5 [UDP-forming] [Iris pallida]|uniref:Cellulose synthase A catalytic subunit 5 [UDP-forming] n=1 Tax=Iris pallida TaxID=29817 RepID=A0AAX6HSZ1_IRIPA|nr:putative cellulose synthase A catalytic subunit 5 [UDP-forming] [Iris pallida]